MGNKILLGRTAFDNLNVLEITSFAETENNLILDTVFFKFSKKVANSNYISLQVKIFDIRVLANIIRQVVGVIRNMQEKNIEINKQNKLIEEFNTQNPGNAKTPLKKIPLAYKSEEQIITNKTQQREEQRTIIVAFDKDTLYINAFYKKDKIAVGFKKIKIEPLIETLTAFANDCMSNYNNYVFGSNNNV